MPRLKQAGREAGNEYANRIFDRVFGDRGLPPRQTLLNEESV